MLHVQRTMKIEMIGNWGIELKGAGPDLTAWRILLRPPFDPFVEEIIDERGDYLVLLSSTF